eukprot:766691-Hanusia_phi.AAC.11
MCQQVVANVLLGTDQESRRSFLAECEPRMILKVLEHCSKEDREVVFHDLPAPAQSAVRLVQNVKNLDAVERQSEIDGMEDENLALGLLYANLEEVTMIVNSSPHVKLLFVLQKLPAKWISQAFSHINPFILLMAFERADDAGRADMVSLLPPCHASSLVDVCDGRELQAIASLCSDSVSYHMLTAIKLREEKPEEAWKKMRALTKEFELEGLLDWMPTTAVIAMARCLDQVDKKRLLERISREKLAMVLERTDAQERASIVLFLKDHCTAASIPELNESHYVESLALMPEQQVAELISTLASDRQDELGRALRFLKEEAHTRIADLRECTSAQLQRMSQLIPPRALAHVVTQMEASSSKAILSSFSHETRAAILCELHPDDRASVLCVLSPDQRKTCLHLLPASKLKETLAVTSQAEGNLILASLSAIKRRLYVTSEELEALGHDRFMLQCQTLARAEVAALMPWLKASAQEEWVGLLDEDQRREVFSLMSFDDIVCLEKLPPACLVVCMASMPAAHLKALDPAKLQDIIANSEGELRTLLLRIFSPPLQDSLIDEHVERKQTKDMPEQHKQESTIPRGEGVKKKRRNIEDFLDANLLTHAFPNVSRVLRRSQKDSSKEDHAIDCKAASLLYISGRASPMPKHSMICDGGQPPYLLVLRVPPSCL